MSRHDIYPEGGNMTHTVTVSIGRTVAGEDYGLDGAAWTDFQAQTLDAIALWSTVVFQGSGIGVWVDPTDNVTIIEDSYTVVSTVEDFGWIGALRFQLSKLAAAYQQSAIALTIGSTELVPAADGEPF